MTPRMRYGAFRDLAHEATLGGKLVPLLAIHTRIGVKDEVRQILEEFDRRFRTRGIDSLDSIRTDADVVGGGGTISPKLFYALLVHHGLLDSPEVWVPNVVAEIRLATGHVS